MITVLFLTLCSVKITSTKIIFELIQRPSYFSFNFGFSCDANNIILNTALTLPLPIIILNASFINTKKPVNHYKTKSPQTTVFVCGLIMGLVIETLQLVLPTTRVVDVIDVLLCGLCPTITYSIIAPINLKIN